MNRWLTTALAFCMAAGCGDGPAATVERTAAPDAFAGSWRSVTPTLEFIRLSVVSKSSEMRALATRLTFSGVAWEGGARIHGDSLVAEVAIVGAAQSSGVMVARATDARTLHVQLRPVSSTALDLTLVRDN
ncbi:MAG TPA: hypothetical protein VIP11_21340 [Gemmatimonadaceae bacterium]